MATRRQFLKSAAGTGLTLGALAPMAGMANTTGGYKALVCVMFEGGLDTHDCIIPNDVAGYDKWASVRTSLLNGDPDAPVRDRTALLDLAGSGQSFGMAPALNSLHRLYTEGKMAIVPNVGPLIEPTTRQMVIDKSARMPKRVASHNDQRSMWQGLGLEGSSTGWGGLMLDALEASSPYASVAIDENALLTSGRRTLPISISHSVPKEPFGFHKSSLFGSDQVPELLKEHYRTSGLEIDNILTRDFVNSQRRAVDAFIELSNVLGSTSAGNEVRIPENILSHRLAMVAKMISVRGQLGPDRQIFFVRMPGFDTHRNQNKLMGGLQTNLAEALYAFQYSLESMGVADQVTTFTISDFGRTLQSNPSGTDHGWGAHHYVIGGAVNGGRVAGTIPPAEIGHDHDWRRGALIPTTAIEQYAYALGRWFGVSDADLRTLMPGLATFDSSQVSLFRA